MKKLTALAIMALIVAISSGCAGKQNRYYIGQCSIPGHWFCGKVYDHRSDCNMDRRRHDRETSMTGTCYSGKKDGSPDYRTM